MSDTVRNLIPTIALSSMPRPLARAYALRGTACAALAFLFTCCSSQSQPALPVQPVVRTDSLAGPVLAADPAEATFHGHPSKRVLAAAMTYPSATVAVEPEPPLSLTASDGTGLALVSLTARAVIDGPLAFTELSLRFRNPQDRVIEGRFAITLPPEATVSRLAMRLSTGWQEAEMVERQMARRAYEDFLHRRQDPALLEKEAGNEFRARIFPIPARGEKEIILSYSQPLIGRSVSADDSARYRLPLRGLPAIEHLQVSALVAESRGQGANVGYRSVTLEERGYKPTKDFEAEVPATIAGIAADEIVAVRVAPGIRTEPRPLTSMTVLFDTSASRAPGFSGQVRRLGELMNALAAAHGGTMRVDMAAFDQVVVPVYSGPISGFNEDILDKLRAHRPLGASNLDAALAWAATREARARLLIISDAIPTMGPTSAEALQSRVRALAPATERVDMILVGGIRDQEMATALVRGTLARDGVILTVDGTESAAFLSKRLGRDTVSGVKVAIAGAEWVWPETLNGLQPGDEALVFASLGRHHAGESVTVELSGAITENARIPLTPVARPLIERAAVAAHIARLTHEREVVPADKREARGSLEKRIVELSTRYRVLSDFTALLVLETEDDYKRYGIDRRSLADILTVGKSGVEVIHRQGPVLLIAEGRDTTGKQRGKDTDKSSGKSDNKPESKKKAEEKNLSESFNGAGDDADGLAVGKVMTEYDDDTDGILDQEDESKEQDEQDGPSAIRDPEPASTPRDERPRPASRPPVNQPAGSVAGVASGEAAAEASDDTREYRRMSETVAQVRTEPAPAKPEGPPPYAGTMAEIMALLEQQQTEAALIRAIRWQSEEPGDVMALLGLGEALEHAGKLALAARAYGSIIDLFPSRADMRRFAGERLERLDKLALALAVDSYAKAVKERPDHLTGHRLLAYALMRIGDYENAFAAVEAGLSRTYPEGRFAGGVRILREDLGLIAAAWIRSTPEMRATVLGRLAGAGASLADTPSLRFVLNWETDANDVDFHIIDGRGGHAYYSQKELPSGGALYEDVTTGYGPECFTIQGVPNAYPYHLQIHYYSRGPMGYGMGKLEIVAHDGRGNLSFEERPFVVMNDGAYVDLGTVAGNSAEIAR